MKKLSFGKFKTMRNKNIVIWLKDAIPDLVLQGTLIKMGDCIFPQKKHSTIHTSMAFTHHPMRHCKDGVEAGG